MTYAEITGWGKCLPPAILSNHDLSTFLDTSDEWITSRTGIQQRRIAHVDTSDLATVAAQHALAAAGLEANDIDMVILATASPDTLIPSAAAKVAKNLAMKQPAVLDINAACTGFLYALHLATGLVRSGMNSNVLVIGAERLTHYLDWSKRDSCVLFGDGAGAVVVSASEQQAGLLSSTLGSDTEAREILYISDYGTSADRFAQPAGIYDLNFVGPEIFKRAVTGMGAAVSQVMETAGLTKEDVDFVLPHQANLRIIESLAKRLGASEEQVLINIQNYGNTSAATIPIALCEALESGRIKPQDNIMTAAFGAGLTWGAGFIKWGQRVTPRQVSDAALPPCDKTALELLSRAIEQCRQHGRGSMLAATTTS
ncbi:3-oxoacyl-[acyl-carrier-protein] synthase 3 [Neiella marina]|uniref:Beta-ketoacyl-[acyl-carrier-protein] synthase III n=1 Tax=Neiella marina TaxID=508461 RepID=A0A8J2U2F4_9GAMM|nr:ketoacyl-ACP synthase III [Neiella marina]GGA66761.1 3-oxoacyl-[acyl-carrier-protein] synthase 3 [Neiella marina]